jgi:hypothetical protein
MALANIFSKVVELEKKLEQISHSPTLSVSSEPTVSMTDFTKLADRLQSLENNQQTTQALQSLLQRVIALEEKKLDQKLNTLEASMSATQNKVSQLEGTFLGKLTAMENGVLTDLQKRVELLEQKSATQA